jgi:hypothetical protein
MASGPLPGYGDATDGALDAVAVEEPLEDLVAFEAPEPSE